MSSLLRRAFRHTLAYHLAGRLSAALRRRRAKALTRTTVVDSVRIEMGLLPVGIRLDLMNGKYEEEERRLAARFLSSDDKVLELGANIGFLGLYCQVNLGIAEYTSIEANPRTVENLLRNYAANGRSARVYAQAIAAEAGPVRLSVSEFSCTDSLFGQSGTAIEVEAITVLDALRLAPSPPTAIIMDIEGAESMVDFSSIPPHVTKLIMELHEEILGLEESHAVFARLFLGGFRLHARLGASLFLRRGETGESR